MSVESFTGGCLCGGVRYQVSGTPVHLCYCHCSNCRRAAGAPVVPWGTFARANFRLTRGRLAEYHSTPPVTRGFCATCGTPLTYRHESREGEIDLTLASLDEPALLAPRMHVWVSDKLPWVLISDGLPQYPRGALGS